MFGVPRQVPIDLSEAGQAGIVAVKMFRYLLVGACCAISAGQPLQAEDGRITLTLDVPYGALPWQRLDIYRPETTTPETPVVVFFIWSHGDKSMLLLEGRSFAQ